MRACIDFCWARLQRKGVVSSILTSIPLNPPPARELLLFPSQVGKVEVIKQGAGNWENGHKTWLEGPAAYDYPDVIDGWAFKRPFLNPVFVVCAR